MGPQKKDGPASMGIPFPWPAALSTLVWLEAPIRKRQSWGHRQPMLSSVVRVVCVSIRRKTQTLRDLKAPLGEKNTVGKPRRHIPSVVGQPHHPPYGSGMECVCRQS